MRDAAIFYRSLPAIMEPSTSPERIWKYNQVIFAELLDDIDKHFTMLNIRYMPIKGAYLLCSGLAEKMPFRRMDDIDIVVMKEDFDKVCDYFSHLPEVTFLKHKWYFEKEFAYRLGGFTCYMEIHWLLNFPSRFHLLAGDLFHRAEPSTGMRRLPSIEDALIILLCHTLVHIAHEVRGTLFEEISLITQRPDFSWRTFWDLSSMTGVKPFFCFIFSCYRRENRDPSLIVPRNHWYARFMARFIGIKRHSLVPLFLKRIALELPFVKNPLALLKAKRRLHHDIEGVTISHPAPHPGTDSQNIS